MNTVDFFYAPFHRHKPLLIGLSFCLALAANAEEAVSVDDPIQPAPLVLTLSDKWLDTKHVTPNPYHKFHKPANQRLIETSKPAAADIGCGMDVNPVMTVDSSIANRFVGKCNFNYQY